MSKKSFSAKLAMTAGSGVLAIAPQAAGAAPILVDNRPLSISFDDLPTGTGTLLVPWDIDGNGTGDNNLVIRRGIYSSDTASGDLRYYRHGVLQFATDLRTNNVKFVRSYGRGSLVMLDQSNYVTPSWVNADYRSVLSGNGITTARRYTRAAGGSIQSFSFGWLGGDLKFGVNAFGFGFDIDGAQHLGWGVMKLAPGPDYRLTITKWTYESEPDTPVHVDEIPVPSSGIAALTLLGLGAAGMRQWRKRNGAA